MYLFLLLFKLDPDKEEQKRMDGWMGGWREYGWMDGRMEYGWMMNGRMDEWMEGVWMGGWGMGGWGMDGWGMDGCFPILILFPQHWRSCLHLEEGLVPVGSITKISFTRSRSQFHPMSIKSWLYISTSSQWYLFFVLIKTHMANRVNSRPSLQIINIFFFIIIQSKVLIPKTCLVSLRISSFLS